MKILITGAKAGIGKDTAIAFLSRGHEVHATVHRDEDVKKLQEELATHGEVRVFTLDITNHEQCQRAGTESYDVLVNNAGVGRGGPTLAMPEDVARSVIETNILGTLMLTQTVAAGMLKRGSGRVVQISSVAGRLTLPFLGVYCASKHAVEAMTDAMRLELKDSGVHVSLVEPGAIGTGFNEAMFASAETWIDNEGVFASQVSRMRAMAASLTSGQHGTESVVDAILHAALNGRPRARYIRPRSTATMVVVAERLPTFIRDWLINRQI